MFYVENQDPCDVRLQLRSSTSPGVLEFGNETIDSETDFYLWSGYGYNLKLGTKIHPDNMVLDDDLAKFTVKGDLAMIGSGYVADKGNITATGYITATGTVTGGNVTTAGTTTTTNLVVSGTATMPAVVSNTQISTPLLKMDEVTLLPECNSARKGEIRLYKNSKNVSQFCGCEKLSNRYSWGALTPGGNCVRK